VEEPVVCAVHTMKLAWHSRLERLFHVHGAYARDVFLAAISVSAAFLGLARESTTSVRCPVTPRVYGRYALTFPRFVGYRSRQIDRRQQHGLIDCLELSCHITEP